MKQQLYALTVHRPWGYAITRLDKDVENRNWQCPLEIGSFIAIHNGKKWDKTGAAIVWQLNSGELIPNPTEETDPPGCIIGIARFGGNVEASASPWFVGRYGWILKDVISIPPVPCRGQQGLWKPAPDILEQTRESYRAALRDRYR